MWLTMGKIADRTHDRLGASDLAIVEFRKQMIEAVKNFQQTGQAIGTGDKAIPLSVCSFQGVISKEIDWRKHDAKYVWDNAESVSEGDDTYKVGA